MDEYYMMDDALSILYLLFGCQKCARLLSFKKIASFLFLQTNTS